MVVGSWLPNKCIQAAWASAIGRVWACCVLSCVPLLVLCAEPINPALRAKLLELREQDQRYRQPGMDLNSPQLARADAENREALRKIIADYGWPTSDIAGLDGAQAAFLIVQHSNQEPAFQKAMLHLLQRLAAEGKVPAEQVAYLHDRLSKPQKYGTQGGCNDQGTFVPREIEDPANVDSRRAAMGMGPLAEYIRFASDGVCQPHDAQQTREKPQER